MPFGRGVNRESSGGIRRTKPCTGGFTLAIGAGLAALSLAACASHIRMAPLSAIAPCRMAEPGEEQEVRWISPAEAGDRRQLRAWCEPVGPVARYDPGTSSPANAPLVIASWNIAVGDGRLDALVAELRRPTIAGEPAIVLLIQEAYRSGDMPGNCPRRSGVADRLGSKRSADDGDIMALARTLAMHAVYVPSMRNGRDCSEMPREDRGNAILSTLPLDDVVAIELPFSQQRRVAVSAVVRYGDGVRIASVHFDTVRGHRRQARALGDVADSMEWRQPMVIGGDFNARWLDPGIGEMKKRFLEIDCSGGASHANGRLDRLFARGLTDAAVCERGRDRFGSDHYPLIVRLPGPIRF